VCESIDGWQRHLALNGKDRRRAEASAYIRTRLQRVTVWGGDYSREAG
jgi:hypothetical protein